MSTLRSTELKFIEAGAKLMVRMTVRDVLFLGQNIPLRDCRDVNLRDSSRKMLRLTNGAAQWRIYLNMHLLSSHRGCGHPTAQTLIRSTTKSGTCCREESTAPGSTVSTTLSSVLSKSGIASFAESSIELAVRQRRV